jgi:hypothetical protein
LLYYEESRRLGGLARQITGVRAVSDFLPANLSCRD